MPVSRLIGCLLQAQSRHFHIRSIDNNVVEAKSACWRSDKLYGVVALSFVGAIAPCIQGAVTVTRCPFPITILLSPCLQIF
jgi:hypothetical protein